VIEGRRKETVKIRAGLCGGGTDFRIPVLSSWICVFVTEQMFQLCGREPKKKYESADLQLTIRDVRAGEGPRKIKREREKRVPAGRGTQ